MLALRLVKLIEKHSDELARGLLHKVRSSSRASDLLKVPAEELEQRTYEIYRNLSDWLLSKTEKEIEVTYTHVAKRRASQGVALSHLLWGLVLTKEQLWEFVQGEHVADEVLDLFGELELFRGIGQFFDRATHYSVRAYEELEEHPTRHASGHGAKTERV